MKTKTKKLIEANFMLTILLINCFLFINDILFGDNPYNKIFRGIITILLFYATQQSYKEYYDL